MKEYVVHTAAAHTLRAVALACRRDQAILNWLEYTGQLSNVSRVIERRGTGIVNTLRYADREAGVPIASSFWIMASGGSLALTLRDDIAAAFALRPDALDVPAGVLGAGFQPFSEAACRKRLVLLLEAVRASGCDIDAQQYSFREICHRAEQRWDFRLPADSPAWQTLTACALRAAAPHAGAAGGGAVLVV